MPTVSVACKVPNGLILRLFEPVEANEPVMGGGFRKVHAFRPTGKNVTIKGPAHRLEMAPSVPVIGGYGLTHGVDADFWSKWLEQNKESPLVTSGQIFANEKSTYVESQSREGAKIKSGLEPIDRNNLPKGIEAKNDKAA